MWPIKDRIIGLLEGNHEDVIRRKYHFNPADVMAERLGVPNLTYNAFIRWQIVRDKHSTNTIVIQSGSIADIGALWLRYLKRTKPEVFQTGWWRDRQPNHGEVRLGINVTADASKRRLRVDKVLKNYPADGRLKLGDFIVG